ncbi:hypothetical protein FQR65_LT17269 [Abscondita terminalis]|nr:hypothetical protein FQR65_LT17269 [Abscondita terminalis]
MMYALVVFVEDNVHYVCSTINIGKKWRRNEVLVKWSDDKFYPAKIICTHKSAALLEKLKRSIVEDLPYVYVNQLATSADNFKITIDDVCEIRPDQQNSKIVIHDVIVMCVGQENAVSIDTNELEMVKTHTNSECIVHKVDENNPKKFSQIEELVTSNATNMWDDKAKIVETGSCSEISVWETGKVVPDEVPHLQDSSKDEATVNVTDFNLSSVQDSDCNLGDSSLKLSNELLDASLIQDIQQDDMEPTSTPYINMENTFLQSSYEVQPPHMEIEDETIPNADANEVGYTLNGTDYDSDDSVRDPDYIQQDNSSTSSDNDSDNNDELIEERLTKGQPTTNSEINMRSTDIQLSYEAEQQPSTSQEYTEHVDELSQNSSANIGISFPVTPRVETYDEPPRFEIPKATGRYTRKYFCVYCKKLFAKLPQHLIHCHVNEEAVANLLKIPPGSKDRKRILQSIRRQGDYEHNTYKEHFTGTLLVSRRSNVEANRNVKVVTCPECKGQFFSYCFYQHFKRCKPTYQKGKRDSLKLSKAVYQHLHPKACYNLIHRVFPVLREDACVTIMRYDELAICVMNDMCKIYSDQHFDDMIRAKIRLMGKLLLRTKELDNTVSDLASLITPTKYDLVTQAINDIAGLNREGTHYRAPSVATTLSTLCKRAANIWKVECLKKSDKQKKKNAEDFLSLLCVYNTGAIMRTATENQIEHQRQKIIELPDKGDISKLVSYIRKKRREAYTLLSRVASGSVFSIDLWKSLCKFTLLSLMVFNRRRPGELERIKLQDYESLRGVQNAKNLTEEQKRAARTYKRFEIRGKLNRTVPVLVHWEVELCINLIIRLRSDAGVKESNPYVFGIPSNNLRHQYVRACTVLRDISTDCGALKPHLLRATILRKQIATECAVLDLSDNIIKDVANFMGHADKIHNDIYRLPVDTRDIAQMSNILEIVQGNPENNDSSDNTDEDEVHEAVQPSFDNNNTEQEGTLKKHLSGQKRFCGPKTVWSDEEKEEVLKIFSQHLIANKLPSYNEIASARVNSQILQVRSPQSIRLWIENHLLKKRRKLSFESDDSTTPKVKRMRWSEVEKKCLYRAFSKHINGTTLPSQSEIELAIRNFPALQTRSVKTIKTAVLNEKNRLKKGV